VDVPTRKTVPTGATGRTGPTTVATRTIAQMPQRPLLLLRFEGQNGLVSLNMIRDRATVRPTVRPTVRLGKISHLKSF
jgi:hypothetical protein